VSEQSSLENAWIMLFRKPKGQLYQPMRLNVMLMVFIGRL